MPSMTRGKDFGRGIHIGMLVEESANVTREPPIFGLPGRIKRGRRLAVGMTYPLPARFAFGDKGWKLSMTARNGEGLFVGPPVSIRHNAAYPVCQTRAEFGQRHARSGNTTAPRTPRRGFRRDPALAQFAGKPLTKAVELNRPGVEPGSVKPFGLHRQMHVGARRVGMERQDIIDRPPLSGPC